MNELNINFYFDCIDNNINIDVTKLTNNLELLLDKLLQEYHKDILQKIITKITNKQVLHSILKTNIYIIKHEFKIVVWLFDNLNYLFNIENKDKAKIIINIYHYLLLIDYNRKEYKENNSIKGRSIITTYNLSNIDDYIEKISELLNEYNDNYTLKRSKKNDESI